MSLFFAQKQYILVLISIFAPGLGRTFYGEILLVLMEITIIVNIGLGVFNLIPLPPLDGEKIFRHILPYKAQEWLDRNSYILSVIFIVLWITGTLGTIVSPVIGIVEAGLVKFVYLITSWIV